MKTPKRAYKQDVCPECRSVVHWYSEEVDNGTGYETVNAYGECCNESCDFSVKGLRDHDGWEDHQQEARWIRKNREARLRRKIALLTKELERQKQIAKWQHQKDRESYEEIHKDWYELKRKYQELKKQKKGGKA